MKWWQNPHYCQYWQCSSGYYLQCVGTRWTRLDWCKKKKLMAVKAIVAAHKLVFLHFGFYWFLYPKKPTKTRKLGTWKPRSHFLKTSHVYYIFKNLRNQQNLAKSSILLVSFFGYFPDSSFKVSRFLKKKPQNRCKPETNCHPRWNGSYNLV